MAKEQTSNFDLVLGFEEAKDLVIAAIKAQEPIMLHGKPGIGKSDMIREIAREWKDENGKDAPREFIDIRLPLYESVDLKGYPYLKDRKDGNKALAFAMSEEFPWEDTDPDSTAIILLDEINGAMQSTQLASYQLILDRAIGNKKLAKGVAIVAAGNRESDKGATNPMPKPLENRFLHVEVTPKFDSWATWAIAKGVNVNILGYLAKNQHKLNDFDPQKSSRAFGTPRSWYKASKILELNSNASEETIFHLVASAVGYPTGTEFMAFKRIAHEIPEAMAVLEGKAGKLKISEGVRVDIAYMLVTNVLYKLRDLYEEQRRKTGEKAYVLTDEMAKYTNNFFEYLMDNEKAIGEEFLVVPIGIATKNFNLPMNQLKIPAIKKLMTKTKGVLNLTFKS
jgi:MoxR-like ATPase